jgi:hypothetical protein
MAVALCQCLGNLTYIIALWPSSHVSGVITFFGVRVGFDVWLACLDDVFHYFEMRYACDEQQFYAEKKTEQVAVANRLGVESIG